MSSHMEEMNRARQVGRGSEFLCLLWAWSLQVPPHIQQSRSNMNPCHCILWWMAVYSLAIGDQLDLQPLPSPWRFGCGVSCPNLLIMPGSFWWPATILRLSRCSLVNSHFISIQQRHSSLCPGTRDRDQICISYYIILSQVLWNRE
jgi:hypothetical protein